MVVAVGHGWRAWAWCKTFGAESLCVEMEVFLPWFGVLLVLDGWQGWEELCRWEVILKLLQESWPGV